MQQFAKFYGILRVFVEFAWAVCVDRMSLFNRQQPVAVCSIFGAILAAQIVQDCLYLRVGLCDFGRSLRLIVRRDFGGEEFC